jgi:hypothetical protein
MGHVKTTVFRSVGVLVGAMHDFNGAETMGRHPADNAPEESVGAITEGKEPIDPGIIGLGRGWTGSGLAELQGMLARKGKRMRNAITLGRAGTSQRQTLPDANRAARANRSKLSLDGFLRGEGDANVAQLHESHLREG